MNSTSDFTRDLFQINFYVECIKQQQNQLNHYGDIEDSIWRSGRVCLPHPHSCRRMFKKKPLLGQWLTIYKLQYLLYLTIN
jgi:hypothetical protein